MDITSMLNSCTVAVDEPKSIEESRTPTRTRTPWDAGGYSLPIHFSHESPFANHPGYDDSRMDICIDQFGHKLSDSHSSLSSFASSESASHSRFSSTSTVSSFHRVGSIVADLTAIDDSELDSYRTKAGASTSTVSGFRRLGPIVTDKTAIDSSELDSYCSKAGTSSPSPISPLTSRPKFIPTSSPIQTGNSLPLVTQLGFGDYPQTDCGFPKDTHMARTSSATQSGAGKNDPSMSSPRPASPSDAMLIRRPTFPQYLQLPNISDLVVTESSERYQSPTILQDSDREGKQRSARFSEQAKSHKRAASAPNFPKVTEKFPDRPRSKSAVTVRTSSRTSTFMPAETSLLEESTMDTKEGILSEADAPSGDQMPKCMYIADCDTGSQLRKAVSHIFGRNKMCTRRIPNHVWVWYCRKHYQRARYRNAKEWARTLQYDLVSRQIKRLQDWSGENQRTGEGGVVIDYRLAVRKREQRRLDAQRSKENVEHTDSEEDEATDRPSGSTSTTAVPTWLLRLSGRSHDATKIMEIVNGIEADLASGTLSAWPDIEILPNIIVGKDEADAPTGYAKRKSSNTTHQRSQSLSGGPRNYGFDHEHQRSRSRTRSSAAETSTGWPSQKRKRYDEIEEDNMTCLSPRTQRMRVNDQDAMPVLRRQTLTHRPAFHSINEQSSNDNGFPGIESINTAYSSPHRTSITLLQAPTPQRYSSLSPVAHLDSGFSSSEAVFPPVRRGTHKRAHSDIGFMQGPRSPHFTLPRHEHPTHSRVQEQKPATRRLLSLPSHVPQVRSSNIRQRPFHIRHQSSPTIPHVYHPQALSPLGHQMLPSILLPPSSPARQMTE